MHAKTLTLILAFGCLGAASALALDTPPEGSERVVISLHDISCQSCGASVVAMLERRPGIDAVEFDRDAAELAVNYDPSEVQPEDLVSAIKTAGYQSEIGAGTGSYATALEFPENLDVEWISRAGEDVQLEAHLVPGKVTVFDFYAVWCGPCREIDREMRSILESAPNVALRKINVVDWNSPIAGRYLKRVSALPYVVVYGADGKKVAAIGGLDLKKLRRAIEKGRGS